MDETLLRRLLGAAVLLLAAFALAALLPDPAPAPGARPGAVVTYDLRTGQPLVPARDAGSAREPDGTATAATRSQAAAGSRPSLKVDETFRGNAGEWFVQVGSFESQANARKVLQKLYGLGLPTVIQSVAVGKGLWYRVRVGPYPAEAAATQALATIRQQGYTSAKLVRPENPPTPGGN